jgi:hypothetical protein
MTLNSAVAPLSQAFCKANKHWERQDVSTFCFRGYHTGSGQMPTQVKKKKSGQTVQNIARPTTLQLSGLDLGSHVSLRFQASHWSSSMNHQHLEKKPEKRYLRKPGPDARLIRSNYGGG